MKTYTAIFHTATDTCFARQEFQADTPDLALKEALAFNTCGEAGALIAERYGCVIPITKISILLDHQQCAAWEIENLRMERATHAMFDFIETVATGNTDYDRLQEMARAIVVEVRGAP